MYIIGLNGLKLFKYSKVRGTKFPIIMVPYTKMAGRGLGHILVKVSNNRVIYKILQHKKI